MIDDRLAIAALLASLFFVGCGSTPSPPSNSGVPVAPSGPKCGPLPTQLVDFNQLATQTGATAFGPMQLAVDSTNVYFVFSGELMRVPSRGGAATPMLPAFAFVGQNNDPVVTSTNVALHHVDDGGYSEQIVAVPIQGGNAKTLATSSGQVLGFAADEKNVYFADSVGIQSVPMAGGAVRLLTDPIGAQAFALAVVGSNLVVTDLSGTVRSVPTQGGQPTTLATQQPGASFPMPCNSDTCWMIGGPPVMSTTPAVGQGSIVRLSASGMTTIPAPGGAWSLAFDGSDFFETVGCDVCSGSLVRIPSSGAAPVTMGDAGFVAVDDACVYFSVLGGFNLPSQGDSGLSGSGIYSVAKSYVGTP